MTHQIELGDGDIKCLMGLCSPQPKPTKSLWQIFPGVHFLTNLLDEWPKLGLAQLDLSHCDTDTCSAKYQAFNKLTIGNTWIKISLLLLDSNFNQGHQALLFLTKKSFDCFKSYQRIRIPFQNQMCSILEGDSTVWYYKVSINCKHVEYFLRV